MTTRMTTMTMQRPDRLIPLLSIAVGVALAVYVTLVVMTILFAAWQTQEVSSIRATESTISTLESSYYAQVASLDAINPATLGYVSPHHVEYVTAQPGDAGLSFAGN